MVQFCTRINNMNKLISTMRDEESVRCLIDAGVLRELANLYAREAKDMLLKASTLIWKKLFTIYLKNLYAGNKAKQMPIKNTLMNYKAEIALLLEQISHILDRDGYRIVCQKLFYYTLDGNPIFN